MTESGRRVPQWRRPMRCPSCGVKNPPEMKFCGQRATCFDSEMHALLDSLVESLPTAQVLLPVNYRPEYQHGWGSKTYYSQLRIDPLAPENAKELLQAMLGDDASLQPLKQLLIERTEGNPFFLEES